MRRFGVLALVLASALTSRGAERTIGLSIGVDHPVLAWAIGDHLGIPDGGQAVLWGEVEGCHSLVADGVEVSAATAPDQLTVGIRGRARLGFGLFGLCIVPFSWDGFLEVTASPEVGPDWRLRLTGPSVRLLDRHHVPTTVRDRVLTLVRDRIVDPIEQFRLDLSPPAAEVRALLRASTSGERAAPVLAALRTLRPAGVTVDEHGTQVRAEMNLTSPELEPAPEPALGPEAEEAWQDALERWDAFLTFIVKDVAALGPDPSIRDDLLALLLSDRHTLLAVLREEPRAGVDPVRQLFLDTWDELRTIIVRATRAGHLHDRALRYVSFLAAGDALAVLDAAGPDLGITISSDGLRRLARIVSPDALTDPLAYSETPDADLRALFGFHEPEATPPPIPPASEPESWWRLVLPDAAYAATTAGGELASIGRTLERWVPRHDQLSTYRELVDRLLGLVAARAGAELDPRFGVLYPRLVRTTAWQESCWRQFVTGQAGQVTFIYSGSGDIGMMQVNRRVWRGFFELEKLKWDVVYNVGAGAEILARLLDRLGAREATEQLGNAARATYSAYNGGPAAYRRYRATQVPRRWRLIDELFWDKYQRMTAEQVGDAVLCL